MASRASIFQRAYRAYADAQMARAEAQVARYRHLYADRNGRPLIQDPGH